MQRRTFIGFGITSLCSLAAPIPLWAGTQDTSQWKRLVSKAQYQILFEGGTEPAYSSELLHEKREGIFACAACYQPLFQSTHKYQSGTGWPSFWQAIEGALSTQWDFKLVWPRTEYHCSHCGGHQGHVFDDGPEPSGLRYCNNGLALLFFAADQPLPTLRSPGSASTPQQGSQN